MTTTTDTDAIGLTEDELRKRADAIGWVGEDSTTPPGYYVATVVVLGGLVTYLLDKENRAVVGRIENHRGHLLVYAGGGLKGGRLLPGIGAVDGCAPLLAQIATTRGQRA